ncbi:MAG: hypothetical protein JNJ49_11715 [Bdellovibrionaceae bacterium]|nr:hypothetical protein [Pseudobdellovibrionaceae bacterium]
MRNTLTGVFFVLVTTLSPLSSNAQLAGLEYRYENLPKVFEMLMSGTPVQSTDYEAILDWAGKMRETPFRGSAEEAKRIKTAVDQVVESRLSYEKLEAIDKALHITGALDVYKGVPAPGRYYDIFSRFDGRLATEQLTETDRAIFNAVLRKRGWTLDKLKATALRPAREYTKTGEIYNGFPRAHLAAIASSHMRSGLAYGPPGSVQIPGLFTTAKRASSLEWGQTKARGLGFSDYSDRAAALLVIRLSPNEPVFNVPDGDQKRPFLQLGYEFSSLSGAQLKKLSPYARHLLKIDDHGMSAMMALTGAKIYRTTIYMDAGLGMGKELVVVDRSAIRSLHFEAADGQRLDTAQALLSTNETNELKRSFNESLHRFIAEKKFADALKLVGRAAEFESANPVLVKEVLERTPAATRMEFLKHAITSEKHNSISLLLRPEYLLKPDFINDPLVRKNLNHWFAVQLDNADGFRELRYEQYQERGIFQLFAVRYLRALDKKYPAEAIALASSLAKQIPDYRQLPTQLTGGMCSQLFRAAQ